jgi:hypothetical protein
VIYKEPKRLPGTDLRGKEKLNASVEVKVDCSYLYNGGITIGDDWYPGFEVDPPIIPRGYELVGMGVGAQLNARPPYSTLCLRRIK